MFSIGVGPSSSHTVGPMRAARAFVHDFEGSGLLPRTHRLQATLYGSLALTGMGHGTDRSVLAGWEGHDPEDVDTDYLRTVRRERSRQGCILVDGRRLAYDDSADLVADDWHRLAAHPNGMRFRALDESGRTLLEQVWYSIGGGFIRRGRMDDPVIGMHERRAPAVVPSSSPAEATPTTGSTASDAADSSLGFAIDAPYPFSSCDELMAICDRTGLRVSDVMLADESALRPAAETRRELLRRARVMSACIDRGCHASDALLPGGLEVRRRAPAILRLLMWNPLAKPAADLPPEAENDPPNHASHNTGTDMPAETSASPGTDAQRRERHVGRGDTAAFERSETTWIDLFAMAVSEENAGGGRIVTAPTNGSAGIIPAVLEYYRRFVPGADDEGIVRFLLTAGAIGYLFRRNASIAGAEVGCQGEVGSACSMAAAGLCEVLGGTPEQVENAAEIGIEHHLGLTCDPVGGLVQIPCIERNAVAANTAVNAARIALLGDGTHRVSLDQAIRTMKQTGDDMMSKYKETSQGGLAVNVVEC
ncbi:L-serine ammonia-lyase [uncultured Bifidobacterium sp.]|uniref:L-serine ammonia-lyase n=1 Tax=uncultured Bifidobacterium sp. TaxID=165187 RepID=UPI0037DDA377